MKKILFPGLLSVVALLLFSCGEKNENKNLNDQSSDTTAGVKEASPQGMFYFSGIIDHKYPIRFYLNIEEKTVTGTYYYTSMKKELELKGTINGSELELDEFVNDKKTGHFTGKIFQTDSITGKWISTKGKELSFDLFSSDDEFYLSGLREFNNMKWDISEVKKFAKKFKEVSLPYTYSPYMEDESAEDAAMTYEEVSKFITPDFSEEDWMMTFYYGVVYYTENYIGFVYTDHYHPGAFGINNYGMSILIISHNGEMISRGELGCNCMDSNMGSNEYYSSESTATIYEDKIIVESTNTHATLFEEEESETEPFEEITTTKRTITVSKTGNLEN
jgi:hypothetical protein